MIDQVGYGVALTTLFTSVNGQDSVLYVLDSSVILYPFSVCIFLTKPSVSIQLPIGLY